MRRLLLIRHAKSSWKFPELDDHERPLNKRGQRDVVTMARYCADQDEPLDVIYSSTATRALAYAELLSEFCNISLVPDLSFYTFSADELLEVLRNLPDDARRVAVVAHNPAITQVVNRLTDAELGNVPTSGIVAMDCSVESWQDLGENEQDCALSYFVSPKMLT